MSDIHPDGRALNRGTIQIINTFTLKPGKMDEFVAIQEDARRRFSNSASGPRGSRMYRSLDDVTAVLISVFDTKEDQEAFQQSASFIEHKHRIGSLIERASPALYKVAYDADAV